ncbi:conserved membrane hypothetical protein [uncultured Mycobacterium sp.]|uniref:Linalool dehydratase/isomerase domain-containing protein n=1 Tax=uncultured Mycobacterium sp. TaxID=171292 RepID=A0A1Y5PKB2_9MYCO|nr:conserved membrane hypothetical protein [uncultured Mycobacterium sp.]
MSLTVAGSVRESGVDSFDLPHRSRFNGPVASRRLRRTLAGYLILVVIGSLPTFFATSTACQALGLGLVAPGGGFLVFGWWAILGVALTLVAFAASFLLWFATGNVLAPIVTWLGAALVAAGAAIDVHGQPRHGPLVATVAIVAMVLGAVIFRRAMATRRATRRRAERARYLPTELAAIDRRCVPAQAGPRELDDTQLGHLRWLLGLGLQPVDQFDGFDVIEQFQPSALRYQINHVQYALAQAQRHYTPNFHGYLSAAQERLIEKLTIPTVWKYWRLERLWGRLSTNYDPAGFENIMLTGWSGICLNTFHANTGSDRFVGPDSLTFSLGNPRKTYRHDTHSFNDSLMRNFNRSPQTVYACEPNWTYSACNIYGINSVASHDAAFGTDRLDELREPFLRGLREELMSPAGDVIPFRSDYTGISIPFGAELMYFQAAGWIAPVFPQFARTLWAIACRETLKLHHGGLDEYLAKPFPLDAGNYRNTGLFARAAILFAAREFGDVQIADAAERAVNAYNEPVESGGMRRLARGSTFANALLAQALFTRPGDWTRLITTPAPASARTGPLLEHVEFTQATVAQAVSDGTDLRLVLRAVPGADHSGGVRLDLSRLRPAAVYTAIADGTRSEFTSDASGRASVDVVIAGRTEMVVAPSP